MIGLMVFIFHPQFLECLKLLKKNLKVKKSKVIDEMLKNYCNWQNNEYVSKISSDFILEELNRSKLKSNNFFFSTFHC